MQPSTPASPQGMPDPAPVSLGGTDGPPPPLEDGFLLGKYRLTRRIGHGGMGVVYEAEDTVLRRRVAIKVLTGLASAAPEVQDRFHREARAAARLNHANVVVIHDVGRQDGVDYLVMELIPGGNAQEWIDKNGAYPWAEATRLLCGLCRGVASAHAAGLIHRDIKPGNVMLAPDGQPKLADFGLAKASDSSVTTLTGGGRILGTPHYMSPEQCRAERVDERTDIYSLGATYFALLTGHSPYPAEVPVQVMFAHCSNPVPDPRVDRPGIPEPCSDLLKKAMAKYANERYPSVTAMLADLQAILEGTAVRVASDAVRSDAAPGAEVSLSLDRAPSGAGRQRTRRSRVAPVVGVLSLLLLGVVTAKRFAGPSDGHADTTTGGGDVPAHPHADAAPPVLSPFRTSLRETGMEIQMGGTARTVAFSPDGKLFAAGCSDGEAAVRVWDFESGEEKPTRWTGASIHSVVFSPDSRTLAAAGLGDILVWDMDRQRETRIPTGDDSLRVVSLSFSKDGKTLAAGLQPKEDPPGEPEAAEHVLIADVASGRTRLLPARMRWVWSVAFSPDGNLLAAASMDWKETIWDYPSLTQRQDLVTDMNCFCVAFSPNSRTLAVTGERSIQLWSPYTATKVGEIRIPHGVVSCAAFSPDGRLLAAAADQVTVWEVSGGKQLGAMEGHAADVAAVAFSPDGSTLASACTDGVVRLRDLSAILGGR